jgi:thiol-disulfide isomerase/thioredoxin
VRAPRVALPALAGGVYQVGRPAGRVVFLDFWASWCEPCRLSLPIVEAFARAHPDVDVVAVDEDEPPEAGAAFAREHHLARVVFDQTGRAKTMFGVSAFPTMVALDPRGFVRAQWVGFNPAIGVALEHARRTLSTKSR